MKSQTRMFLAIAFFAAFAAGCTSPASTKSTAVVSPTPLASPASVTIPPEISVPGERSFEAYAKGVQLYECKATPQGQFEWLLNEPAAELFDSKGNSIGWHSAGPTWELKDQSKAVGDASKDPATGKDKVARATVDPNAIAWLRLPVKSADGVFGKVQTIQRLSTTDGKAPVGGCDQAHAGNKRPVYYTATYYFYDAKP